MHVTGERGSARLSTWLSIRLETATDLGALVAEAGGKVLAEDRLGVCTATAAAAADRTKRSAPNSQPFEPLSGGTYRRRTAPSEPAGA